MNDFSVSVITPVYNAEDYVEKAVRSALAQFEVGEVVLVEDDSPDDALAVCRKLEDEHKRVKLFRHPNGENRGAAASRNLGIEKSTCSYIAFLDADDWYCKNRFAETKEAFENHQDVDGVYDAVGTHFETDKAREKWFQYRDHELTVPQKRIDPDELLEGFLLDAVEHFHTNGITVKKRVFKQVGGFDTALEISQDTHMWLRLAAACRLYPADITNARAIRRVHNENRWTTNQERISKFQKMYWRKLDTWAREENLPPKKQAAIHCAHLIYKSGMAKESAAGDSQIRYFRNNENLGIPKSRNKALNKARGQYVAVLDGDDVWRDAEKLESQVAYLDNNSKCGAVGTWTKNIDDSGAVTGDKKTPQDDEFLKKTLFWKNQIVNSSSLFRKKAAKAVGGYDDEYAYSQDFELWLAIGKNWKLANLPHFYTGYRTHGENASVKKRRLQLRFTIKAMKRHGRAYPWGQALFILVPLKKFYIFIEPLIRPIVSFVRRILSW